MWSENFHETSERDRERMAQLYPDGMHGAIAAGLTRLLGDRVEVRTATLDQPAQGLGADDRVLSSAPWDTADDVIAHLLAPYAVGASLVYVAHPDAAALDRRRATEKVTRG